MTNDDKKELADLEQKTTQLKYGLMFSLAFTALATPFFFMVLLTTNLMYPILAGIAGWITGHYYAKFLK